MKADWTAASWVSRRAVWTADSSVYQMAAEKVVTTVEQTDRTTVESKEMTRAVLWVLQRVSVTAAKKADQSAGNSAVKMAEQLVEKTVEETAEKSELRTAVSSAERWAE
jgi:hypothetical protein